MRKLQPVNREQIITELYNSKELRSAIKAYCRTFAAREDLLHLVIERVCALPEENIFNLYQNGKLKHYAFITMVREVMLPRSNFNKQNFPTYEFIDDLELDVVDEQTERVGLDPELIHEFKAFCDQNKTNPDLSLQSLVTLEYMEYEPIKKRSYRDFQKKTGIHYSSACVYVRTMVKEFNKAKQ